MIINNCIKIDVVKGKLTGECHRKNIQVINY